MVWDNNNKETQAMWAGETMGNSEAVSRKEPKTPAEKGIEMAFGWF
jgi:hypothetical protein